MTLSVKADRTRNGILVTLFNTSDSPREARISGGALRIRAAALCDVFGAPQSPIPLDAKQGIAMKIAPYQRVTIDMETAVIR